MPTPISTARRSRGRPSKYGRPSHAVTVTLPEDILAKLGAVDADLGRAIVALVERSTRSGGKPRTVSSAEIATYGRRGVIVVNPGKAIRRLPGVELVPVGNGRALLSLAQPNSIPTLELAVGDAVDQPDLRPEERRTLEAIGDILRDARRSPGVALEERTIIVLEAKRSRQSSARA